MYQRDAILPWAPELALLEPFFRFNKVAFEVSGFDEIMILFSFQLPEVEVCGAGVC